MEYVYAAMLLHKAGKTIDEASLKKVLEAAGVKADDGRAKALVAALDGVDIEEAVKSAAVAAAPAAAPAAAAPAAAAEAPAEEKKGDKEEEKDEGQAAAGLGALFG
ncbi:50S ribosomal protein P1 [Candidatus Woesearchaeota archaeon]|nr:50S ribosomal protein P1 [Candidatus Woesearchaeota archaeon]